MTPKPNADTDAPSHATGSFAGDTNPANRPPRVPDAPNALLSPPRGDELGWLGPYRVLAELGRGGMGVVYRAEDPNLKRQVALKVMLPEVAADPRAVARFRREAEAQARVEHEHVAVIHHVGEVNGVPFLAMPLLKGQTLAAALKANARPPLAEAVRIAREVAEGLAAAHAAGLVHRDIKPANVWLDGPKRRVRILDFGLARAADPGTAPAPQPDGEPLTASGAIVGTPAYMSPEQALGRPIDARSDLFSLGVLLYQMATGERPFTGQSSYAVLAAVLEHDPLPPHAVEPGVPGELSALVVRLLAKDPAARPASATEVARELEAIEGGITLPAVRAVPFPTGGAPAGDPWTEIETSMVAPVARASEPPPRRTVWLWAALAALVLLCAGALAVVAVRAGAAKGALTVEADDPAWEVVISRGGEVVRDRTRDREFVLPPGEYRVELATPVSNLKVSPERVALADKGKERVRLWIEKPRPAPKPKDPNPDAPPPFSPEATKALEAVLAMGGSLHLVVDRQVTLFKPGDKLPRTPFTVEHVYLDKVVGLDVRTVERFRALPPVRLSLGLAQSGITNDDLAKIVTFPGLANITALNVSQTNLTPGCLALVRKFSKLTALDLSHVKITNTDLADLKGLKLQDLNLHMCAVDDGAADVLAEMTDLTKLWMMHTGVSDAGLKKLTGLKKLVYLHPGAKITDASAESLLQFPELRDLILIGSKFGDAGMKELATHRKLTTLAIDGTISDAGLVPLKDFPALAIFGVANSGDRITDAGLKHIAAAARLRKLDLTKTAVTEAGVKELAKARPDLTIDWDGGKIEGKRGAEANP